MNLVMMRKLLIILVVAITFTACSKDKRVSIPADVIPPEQMVPVLVDFHLAEAALTKAREAKMDVGQLSGQYYYSILKKHQITYKKFNISLRFYSSNLKELYLIYKDVITELSKTQSRIVSRNN